MAADNLNNVITAAVLQLLQETFEKVDGIYLDASTSIFETLATINAAEASQVTSGSCATIAAHVAHMTYYIDILLKFIDGEHPQTDWDHIWNTVDSVTEEEWKTSQENLRSAYHRLTAVAKNMLWENDAQIGGAMGLIAHNAYHLGEIRQMLCIIKAEQ